MKTEKVNGEAEVNEPSVDKCKPEDHVIRMIEKEYKGKLIDVLEARKQGYGSYIDWLKHITKYGNFKNTVLFIDLGDTLRTVFFTGEYEYYIRATLPKNDDVGYLGCIVNCRKARPGETWQRGSDLADGRYCKETFDRIVCDIVSYEMKHLQCF